MSENGIRQPEDAHQPCLTCNRKFFRADAHWCCDRCRLYDEAAACPTDCDACVAMVVEEWRRKAWEMKEYKKKLYEKNKTKVASPSRRSMYNRKKGTKGKSKTTEKSPEKIQQSEKSEKSKKPKIDPVYAKRLLDFETLLYGNLNPSIPANLTEKGFKLSEVPKDLKGMYEVTKCELIRLLASSSICYHLSKNRSQFCDEDNQIFNANTDGIVSLFAALIKFKANSLGKVIFDIREALLSGVSCADPDIISQMIKGPINPKESFFGNIDALKEAVNQNNRNVLRTKAPSCSKDPSSSEELNDEHSSDSNGSHYE